MTTPTRLVFAGDSITDAGRDRTDPGSLGDGYVSLVADALSSADADVAVLNAGISGNRVRDLERRWSADVLTQEPDVLTLFIGINDTWRRFDADDPTTVEAFEEGYRRLLASLDGDAAPRLIVMEPYLLPVREDQEAWLEDLDPKRGVVRRLAAERGATLVPLHELLSAEAQTYGAAELAPDGVHPTPLGSRIIADAWLRSSGLIH